MPRTSGRQAEFEYFDPTGEAQNSNSRTSFAGWRHPGDILLSSSPLPLIRRDHPPIERRASSPASGDPAVPQPRSWIQPRLPPPPLASSMGWIRGRYRCSTSRLRQLDLVEL